MGSPQRTHLPPCVRQRESSWPESEPEGLYQARALATRDALEAAVRTPSTAHPRPAESSAAAAGPVGSAGVFFARSIAGVCRFTLTGILHSLHGCRFVKKGSEQRGRCGAEQGHSIRQDQGCSQPARVLQLRPVARPDVSHRGHRDGRDKGNVLFPLHAQGVQERGLRR